MSMTVNEVEMGLLDMQIEVKRTERNLKYRDFRVVDTEFNSLLEQRERLLYGGMNRHEYISHLERNPIEQVIDGYPFKIRSYNISAEFDTEEGEHVYFSDTVYKDQRQARMSLTTASGRNFIYHEHDCPKTKEKLMSKLIAISISLKMIEPDVSKDIESV
jgi:hypothetical protein